MAIKATYLDTGQEIDLERADEPDMAALLTELHHRTTRGDRPRPGRARLECREHDGPDGPYRGAWVYLRRDRHCRWVLAHFDREKFADHVAAVMTEQHRWQQDYWQRAGDAAGYATIREKKLPGVRLDVAIYGPKATIGVEVQHSALTSRAVLTRTTKARNHGVTSLWSGDRPDAPPDWAYRVPTVLTNELPKRYAPRGSWTVVNGLRTLVPTRCAQPRFHDDSYEGFGGTCPATQRHRPCGAFHARFAPTHGVTVDDVAEQAPAGALVPLMLPHPRGPRVYIVSAADHALYEELATGTYTDPERAARDAAETADVGKTGPCRVVMPGQTTSTSFSPVSTPASTPAPTGGDLFFSTIDVAPRIDPVAPTVEVPVVPGVSLWPPTTIPTDVHRRIGPPPPASATPVSAGSPVPEPRSAPADEAPARVEHQRCSRCKNAMFLSRPGRALCARCETDPFYRLPE